jgi:hypothetical protein
MIEGILFVLIGFCGVGWIWFGLSHKPDIVGRNEAVKRLLAEDAPAEDVQYKTRGTAWQGDARE